MVHCMPLSFIHIDYNHTPVQALNSLHARCEALVISFGTEVVVCTRCDVGFLPRGRRCGASERGVSNSRSKSHSSFSTSRSPKSMPKRQTHLPLLTSALRVLICSCLPLSASCSLMPAFDACVSNLTQTTNTRSQPKSNCRPLACVALALAILQLEDDGGLAHVAAGV